MIQIVNAIVAVGNSGEIGLNGHLLWEDEPTKYFHDIAWFRGLTKDGILICDKDTFTSLSIMKGRTVICDDTSVTPAKMLKRISTELPIWIIGGADTYKRYAHLINRWHIGKIDYDGTADTQFDFSNIISCPYKGAK